MSVPDYHIEVLRHEDGWRAAKVYLTADPQTRRTRRRVEFVLSGAPFETRQEGQRMVDEAMARLNQNMAQQNMEHMDSLPEVLRHWVMSDESDGLVATQVWQIYLQMGRDIPSTLSDLRRRVAVFRSQTRQAMVRR